MGSLEVGFVLATFEDVVTGSPRRWTDLRGHAQMAEAVGFDTVWVADELQWESDAWTGAMGWWECVALTSAVAASTTSIDIGTWVLSALHRNPGLTARSVETLDEISGGRFLFGLGAGHAGRQAEAFGFPPNYTVSRYEEALAIITALRGDDPVTFSGSYHQVKDLVMAPRPCGNPSIPLLLGGHAPRTMGLAADHADIWSAFATTSSQPAAFVEMLQRFDAVCAESGRDPATIGRSIGVAVAAPGTDPTGMLANDDPIRGSVDQIVDTVARFADIGVTSVEIMAAGDQEQTIEGLAPVLAAIKDL